MKPAIYDPDTGPIRTFRQVAEIMRTKGDDSMNERLAEWTHRQALRKLRPLLKEYEHEIQKGS